MTYLWTEHYRPKTLDEYVWRDPEQRKTVEEWLSRGALPHLMLSGVTGTGKTSLAELLLRLLNIPTGDILKINASRERLVDVVQDKIVNFVGTWALGESGIKYILLDEADSMSPLAQRILRGEMEKYHDVCRFILTCNYREKIIPAIHGRCQGFHFQTLDINDFSARVAEIVMKENIEFDLDMLLTFVEASYPDLRKCINLVQQNCREGKLHPLVKEDTGTKDYILEMANLFQAGRYLDARKLIVGQAQAEEYPDIFRFLYQNLHLWGDTQNQQDEALLVIRRGLINHGLVADIEINLAATIVELGRVRSVA